MSIEDEWKESVRKTTEIVENGKTRLQNSIKEINDFEKSHYSALLKKQRIEKSILYICIILVFVLCKFTEVNLNIKGAIVGAIVVHVFMRFSSMYRERMCSQPLHFNERGINVNRK